MPSVFVMNLVFSKSSLPMYFSVRTHFTEQDFESQTGPDIEHPKYFTGADTLAILSDHVFDY